MTKAAPGPFHKTELVGLMSMGGVAPTATPGTIKPSETPATWSRTVGGESGGGH